MKKIILLFALILGAAFASNGQTIITDKDGNYIAVKQPTDTSTGKPTGKTYTDTKGQKFPVYISKNGKLYVNRISQKTGQPYKQYLKITQ
jgi:uncharacterized protein YxeA